MSPDNVFAAQMWAWPDAVIKRNAHGQVMVVNAAFLSLYGGRVEDWQGNAVHGWSAPPEPGNAVRFETRVPDAATASDRVFDWIESALPDGSSLAVARDVTAIQPSPGQTAPAEQAAAEEPADTVAPPPAAEPVFETVMSAPVAEAPVKDPAVAQPPVAVPYVADAPIAEAPADESSTAKAPALPEPTPVTAPVAASAAPAIPDVPHTAPEAVAEDAPASDDTREYERRALPLENESAVLGNNWRDAVIAKAVGATGAEAPVEAQTVEAAPEATTPTGAEGIRILLAEDNAINALLTRTLLEAEGCIVDTVEDGIYAVEAMKTKAYDLIFMDMRMPQMDGLIATRKIRAMDHASKGLPIVALTANAFDDDRNACFDAGMNDFMTKPVSAEELSEMVARWLEDKRTALAS